MRIVLALLVLIAQSTSRPPFFSSPYPLDQMKGKQAVVETDAGTFVMQLLPEAAPNHVGHFMKMATDGGYVGTVFHRVIRYGLIQGGDPLSRDPSKSAAYGSGGFGDVKAELNAEKHSAGAVSAVLQAGRPDSGGSQFFVCVSDQPSLDGQYTVFARVVEGLEVVQQISAVEADSEGRPRTRIAIKAVVIRDAPPPVVDPFVRAPAGELAGYRAVLETSKGKISLQFLADKAPETVRNFLELAAAGVYDDTLVHRVVPNFVIQTGAPALRRSPLTVKQQALIHNLPPEFSDTPHVAGIVSMAHGDDPASAQTSFFICTGECRALDGKYTAFARVESGMEIVKAIEAVPVDGETPKEPVVVSKITIEKK
jgi:peptidyl-prolyl cis-trans isomerase B (cyclophilin B)